MWRPFAEFLSWSIVFYKSAKVAAAQGKQNLDVQISRQEKTGNLPYNIRDMFLQRENFEVLKISCTKFVMGCCNLLVFVGNFEQGDIQEGE